MLKYASAKIMTTALVPQDASARDLHRFAHRHHFDYQVRPGYLYVRSRAISSRCNDNFDEFPAEELEKGYRTFIGKPVFVNHNNEDISRSRGVIIDAVLHKDSNRDGTKDWWVEVLQEVDALRFPRLAAEIINGNIARTSMGTDVSHSICSACGNRATTPAEYCAHIPGSKGMMLYKRTASGQKVGEIIRETCYGLRFFENSLLVEPPADPTAAVLGTPVLGPGTRLSTSGVDTRGMDKIATTGSRVTLDDLMTEGAAATPPEDHPWFSSTGLSHHNIVDHWDASTPEEQAQGKRWYPDAHLVAKSIAKLDPRIKSDAEAAHKGGGVLSAYSPQQGWWANQHNAARSFHEQRAIGKGEGIMVMGSHATAAQKILDGMPHHEALKGPKTQDFASLIEHGGNKPQSEEDAAAGKPKEHSDKVVVDRHALSVAAGRRLNADDVKGFPSSSRKHYEVVANHYRKAAAVISDREGREVPPHEVQAVTWLARQRMNAEGDTSGAQKGRNTNQRNQRKVWQDTSREHSPELHDSDPPNSHVAAQDPDDDDYEVNGDNGAAHWRGRDPGSADCATCGYPVTYNIPQRNPLNAGWGHADAMKRDHPATPSDGRDSGQEWERTTRARENARRGVDRHMQTAYDKLTFDEMTKGLHHSRKLAYGETKAPEDVDTLREDACPVCGDRDTFDGATCQVCGYVAPPKMFQDPDLEKARQLDLRKDIAEFNDPANPNQLGADGQPQNGQAMQDPADPGALDENGNPVNPDAADPNAQPGGLPGEVQAEVQPGGDPMGGGSPLDPAALGPDGQPQDPNELGAPVDPAMLGPDGQPLQQPGQQMMVGPDGMPIGPQTLPPGATTNDGKPFTPGPNMPQGPGEPEGPEGPAGPEDLDGDGQIPNPDAGQQAPGTPGDGVPDLQCPACGFSADATAPVSMDMDTATLPPTGEATPDGIQAGDVCPNCGAGQLMSPAEMQGETPLPVPV